MANTIRNLEEVIERLDSYIKANEGRVEALKKIEFPTKKDGSEFAVFSKNFTNCRIESDVTMNPHNLKLSYYYNDGVRTFNEDWINLYLYIDEMAKDDPRREKANPHITLLRDSYSLTVQETKQAIADRISLYEKYIEEYKQAKEKATKDYKTLKAKINEVHELIKSYEEKDYTKPNTLYYSFCDLAEYGVRHGLKD